MVLDGASSFASSSRAGLSDEEVPADGGDEFLSRQEWLLACRVAASKGLRKSELLPRFLLYVCEQYLLGRADQITEQQIGIRIFNRPEGYNPGEDNIVRSYARMLRKRLDQYFEGEGRAESMRIRIPRGGYIPAFQSRFEIREGDPEPGGPLKIAQNEAPSSKREAVHEGMSRKPIAWTQVLLGFLAGALLTGMAWMAIHWMQSKTNRGAAHPVWTQMFQQNRNTLIVASDSGLGILENISGHLVSVEEYANGTYLSDLKSPPGIDPESLNDLRRQRYTSVVSLGITSALIQLPEFIPNRAQVRYARNITAEDIKNANTILIGSEHTNPWVSLFQQRLNFKLSFMTEVDKSYVLNEHPQEGEQKVYNNGAGAATNQTYGAIAFLPDPGGAGHVLIIQGLNMAGTQAAADTLFNAKLIKPVLQQAGSPTGALKPFELLVETSSIGAAAPGARIIATRFYSQ